MSTISEDENGWLQENLRSIIITLALVIGVSTVAWYLPRAKEQAKQDSWLKYGAFQEQLFASETADDLNAALASVESEDSVYPWALNLAVAWAGSRDDTESLALLEGRLNNLGDKSTGVKVLEDGESVEITEAVQSRVAGLKALSDMMAEPVAAEGSGVTLTVSNGAGTTYTIPYNLYQSQAPAASAWLLGLIDAGALTDLPITPSPQGGIQLRDLPVAEDATELSLEKAWGCFHAAGTICTMLDSGRGSGAQSNSQLHFLTQDLYAQDGVTTVIAQALDAEDTLEALIGLERSTENPQEFAEAWTLTLARTEG